MGTQPYHLVPLDGFAYPPQEQGQQIHYGLLSILATESCQCFQWQKLVQMHLSLGCLWLPVDSMLVRLAAVGMEN